MKIAVSTVNSLTTLRLIWNFETIAINPRGIAYAGFASFDEGGHFNVF